MDNKTIFDALAEKAIADGERAREDETTNEPTPEPEDQGDFSGADGSEDR